MEGLQQRRCGGHEPARCRVRQRADSSVHACLLLRQDLDAGFGHLEGADIGGIFGCNCGRDLRGKCGRSVGTEVTGNERKRVRSIGIHAEHDGQAGIFPRGLDDILKHAGTVHQISSGRQRARLCTKASVSPA